MRISRSGDRLPCLEGCLRWVHPLWLSRLPVQVRRHDLLLQGHSPGESRVVLSSFVLVILSRNCDICGGKGPWWWSSGQCPRLLLGQSEFESCWLLKIYARKDENEPKMWPGWKILKKVHRHGTVGRGTNPNSLLTNARRACNMHSSASAKSVPTNYQLLQIIVIEIYRYNYPGMSCLGQDFLAFSATSFIVVVGALDLL